MATDTKTFVEWLQYITVEEIKEINPPLVMDREKATLIMKNFQYYNQAAHMIIPYPSYETACKAARENKVVFILRQN